MRKFKVFYSDNSGPKCEEFQGNLFFLRDKWLEIWKDNPSVLVIAIPTDMIYSVEEID